MNKFASLVTVITLTAAVTPALAHSGHGGGFSAGFLHPMMGADHVLAMLAVGIWAAMRGERALWLWPAAFVNAMIGGFILAQANFTVPVLEPMIASTVILLGWAIALGLSAPVAIGAGVIALAGAAHGFAHGLEVQGSFAGFACGFALSTTLLHLAGIGSAMLFIKMVSPWAMRAAGAAIAAAGLAIALT